MILDNQIQGECDLNVFDLACQEISLRRKQPSRKVSFIHRSFLCVLKVDRWKGAFKL